MTYWRLKGAEEVAQIRVVGAKGQDFPLYQSVFDVFVVYDFVFAKTLDGEVVPGVLHSRQHNLPKKI